MAKKEEHGDILSSRRAAVKKIPKDKSNKCLKCQDSMRSIVITSRLWVGGLDADNIPFYTSPSLI